MTIKTPDACDGSLISWISSLWRDPHGFLAAVTPRLPRALHYYSAVALSLVSTLGCQRSRPTAKRADSSALHEESLALMYGGRFPRCPRTAATLILTITDSLHGSGLPIAEIIPIPIDNEAHKVTIGLQPQIQTIVNNSITSLYVDSGIDVTARLVAVASSVGPLALLDLRVAARSVLQQAELPVRLTPGALFAVSSYEGRLLLENGCERHVYTFTRQVWNGSRASSARIWDLRATLHWDGIAAGELLVQAQTVRGRMAFVETGAQTLRSTHDWETDLAVLDPAAPVDRPRPLVNVGTGKEVESVTEVNSTRSSTYVEAVSRVLVDGLQTPGSPLVFHVQDRVLSVPPDITSPGPNYLGNFSGEMVTPLTGECEECPIRVLMLNDEATGRAESAILENASLKEWKQQ